MQRKKNPAYGNQLRKGRMSLPNHIYHITTTTFARKPVFKDLFLAREVVKCLYHPQRTAETLAYVVMPDHLHWLLALGEQGDMSSEVRIVKSFTTHRVNEIKGEYGSIWQPGYYDHAIRKDEDLRRVARYIVANPIRAGIADDIGQYSLWDAVWL